MTIFIRHTITLSLSLLAISCENMSSTDYALLGAAAGGVLGAVVGENNDVTAEGAVLGAGAGAAIGAVLGGQVEQRREQLEQEQAIREAEYNKQVQEQAKIEQEIKDLENQKTIEALARTTTDEDVRIAEEKARQVEEELARKKQERAAAIKRAEDIKAAQDRLEKAMKELEELEASQ